jgi:putative hydrolase of the HAD superfamily
VYFDLDDTLCAYWDAVRAALPRVWLELGDAEIPTEKFIQTWARCFRAFCPTVKGSPWQDAYFVSGEPTRTELMRLTLDALGVAANPIDVGNRYAEIRNESLKLFPDALETLSTIAQSARLGLITNGPADVQRSEIDALGLDARFDYVLIEGEMRMGKPHAEVFQQAEQLAGHSGGALLMVGNSFEHDIVPAIHAGWHTAWVCRPSDVPPSTSADEVHPTPPKGNSPAPSRVLSELSELLD